MVDSIGTRPVVPVPRIRRPADDENKGESQSSGKGGHKAGKGTAESESGRADNKGRLIDDQA